MTIQANFTQSTTQTNISFQELFLHGSHLVLIKSNHLFKYTFLWQTSTESIIQTGRYKKIQIFGQLRNNTHIITAFQTRLWWHLISLLLPNFLKDFQFDIRGSLRHKHTPRTYGMDWIYPRRHNTTSSADTIGSSNPNTSQMRMHRKNGAGRKQALIVLPTTTPPTNAAPFAFDSMTPHPVGVFSVKANYE